MRRVGRMIGVLVLSVASAGVARAENWAQWRGPLFNGSSPTEKNLPTTWSKTENVAWAAPMPGPGDGTPIIWEDRVFVTSAESSAKNLLALCFSAKDGKELWRRKLGVATYAPKNPMACCSPATDGRRAYFLFGSGDLAALDFDGRLLWSRNLVKDFGNLCIKYGYSSSPLVYKDRLYVVLLRRPKPYYPLSTDPNKPLDSFLLAVDPATGKDLWRCVRPSQARDESFESYASPIPYEGAGRSEILLNGGDSVTGHDAQTGRELWRWTYNPEHLYLWRLIPSLVTHDRLIYFVTPRGKTLYALKAGGAGELAGGVVAWKYDGPTTDVCTPLVYDGVLYVLEGDQKVMTALDPLTGKEKWQGKLGGGSVFRASPTGADGKIYCINEAGDVWVLAAGNEFKVLSRISLGGEPFHATPAVANGRLYVRTATRLYCIGRP